MNKQLNADRTFESWVKIEHLQKVIEMLRSAPQYGDFVRLSSIEDPRGFKDGLLFDMGNWSTEWDCGTVCCLWGSAHVLATGDLTTVGGPARNLNNCVVACPTCNSRKQERDCADVFGAEVTHQVESWIVSRNVEEEEIIEAAQVEFVV